MHPKNEGALIKMAARVRDLNKNAFKAILEGDSKTFVQCGVEYEDLKTEIKRFLIDMPVAKIHDPQAQEVISRISRGDKFQLDELHERLQNETGTEFVSKDVLEDMGFFEEDKFINEYLFSWLRPSRYINDLCSIGSLIIGVSIPPHLSMYVEEARQCYALEQYQAVYSLCRTVIEVAVRDVGQRRGKLPRDKGNVKYGEFTGFSEMRSKVVPARLRGEVGDIYSKASRLIHGNKTIRKADAANLFRRTLLMVQELYG
jgi:hypothetical protein